MTPAKPETNKQSAQQSGFSLVELMIGLVIGLLATLVVMRMFTVFETQRRTTIGAADAQTNGNIAFYTVARELQMAGFSSMPDKNTSMMKCANLSYKVSPAITGLDPVTLVDGPSDSVTIRYGSAATGGALVTVTKLPGGNDMVVKSNLGCKKGDIIYIAQENGANCAMSQIQDIVEPTLVAPDAIITLTDNQAIATGVATVNSKIACLGPAWNEVRFSVVNGNLAQNGNPIVAEVVNIQAQYGVSASPSSNDVVSWVDPVGAWANPAVTDRNRIKAVRIAIVARNPQRDAQIVSQPCSSLTAASPTGLCAWDASTAAGGSPAPLIDLSVTDADWDHYRYQVFESVIPIRNVIRARKTL